MHNIVLATVAAGIDAPCCFNTFTSSATMLFLTYNPAAFCCPQPTLPPLWCAASTGLPGRLVTVSVGACGRGGKGDTESGRVSAATKLMLRNMAALLYRRLPGAMLKAESASSSSRFPPPDSDDEEEAIEGSEEEGISEEKTVELECLEEQAMAAAWDGREPGDYDRRAHLFDESSRVFQALKEREEGRHHGSDEGS